MRDWNKSFPPRLFLCLLYSWWIGVLGTFRTSTTGLWEQGDSYQTSRTQWTKNPLSFLVLCWGNIWKTPQKLLWWRQTDRGMVKIFWNGGERGEGGSLNALIEVLQNPQSNGDRGWSLGTCSGLMMMAMGNDTMSLGKMVLRDLRDICRLVAGKTPGKFGESWYILLRAFAYTFPFWSTSDTPETGYYHAGSSGNWDNKHLFLFFFYSLLCEDLIGHRRYEASPQCKQ